MTGLLPGFPGPSAAGAGARAPAAGTPGTGTDAPAASRIDLPAVVAEVRAVFDRYEVALCDGDVAILTELFWADPRCVRYGVADRQHGAEEIAAWRRANPGVPPGRVLSGTVVLATGASSAVVSTLFTYPDGATEGRQTQVWVRFPELDGHGGWRIVAAHVSEVPR
ncbi:AtzH-like domain-containing protein [Pseudonocardia sp. RS010]|uniref:AtzH-like domain-containing protein n=1 Tax=Pseudonocardia sp. RS010 TaxID=3385979 RepID=UPI0039A14A0E